MVNRIKDLPLAEITLRKYEKPANLEKRELLRKICLSLGLLQLGDSRDIIVDILMVLVDANKAKEKISSEEVGKRVEELRKKYSLDTKGLAESNIRRQLKRLRDAMYIEKSENKYYLIENSNLYDIFVKNIEKFVIPPIIERVKDYLIELDKVLKETEKPQEKIKEEKKEKEKEKKEEKESSKEKEKKE